MSDKNVGSYPSHLLQLRVRELVLLELIERAGSLRGAAQELHVTQPAVTQALRHLEDVFGATLVHRGTRGEHRTQLTPSGRAALQRLRVVGEELRLARRAAGDALHRQELRVGALPFMAMDWLPDALSRLATQQPSTRVRLVEGTVRELWNQLADGQLDLIANYLLAPREMRNLATELAHRVVQRSQVVPIAPASHELFGRKTVPLAYLAQQRWVFPPPEAQAHADLVDAFLKAGVQAPEPELVAERHASRIVLAQRLHLLTVVPLNALKWQAGSPRMRRVPNSALCWSANVVLAARKATLGTPSARALYDLFA